MTERPQIYVHLLPSLIPTGALKGGVAVVVDVLRATTVMVHALASGCEAVIPCLEIEDARAVASGLRPGETLLGGERGGLPIEGFDLGNSPATYTPEACRGRTLVMTTTNGTRAILASLEADRILIAGFVNQRATVDELALEFLKADHGRHVHIVCSGTEGEVSLEDALLAGALAKSLTDLGTESLGGEAPLGNDSAFLVVSQWLEVERYLQKRPLGRLLRLGRGGRNVRRIGLEPDIDDAARVDRFGLVAELRREPLRIVDNRDLTGV
jgi:2-phosphosulfolactate phosphatase